MGPECRLLIAGFLGAIRSPRMILFSSSTDKGWKKCCSLNLLILYKLSKDAMQRFQRYQKDTEKNADPKFTYFYNREQLVVCL